MSIFGAHVGRFGHLHEQTHLWNRVQPQVTLTVRGSEHGQDGHWPSCRSVNVDWRAGGRIIAFSSLGAAPMPGTPLTIGQILSWADAYYAREKTWPQAKSAGAPADGPSGQESWRNLDQVLRKGLRGLPAVLPWPGCWPSTGACAIARACRALAYGRFSSGPISTKKEPERGRRTTRVRLRMRPARRGAPWKWPSVTASAACPAARRWRCCSRNAGNAVIADGFRP